MSETNTLRMTIDSTSAEQGSARFEAAVAKINAAVNKMDQETSKAFSKIQGNVRGLDFSSIAADIAKLGTAHVDASLANNLQKISDALRQMRGPSANAVRNMQAFNQAVGSMRAPTNIGAITQLGAALRSFRAPSATTRINLQAFGTALATMKTPTGDVSKIAALSSAVTNFRAPSQAQSANLRNFFASLRTATVPQNLNAIIQDLNRLTQAAQQASNAMSRIRPVNIPTPRQRGGGGGGGSQRGAGGGVARGSYDGLFSGGTRATGEIRGLENLVNPTFQAASALRTALGTLTLGSFISEIYSAGNALTTFNHVLEVTAGSTQEVARRNQLVTDTALALGLPLKNLREEYGKLSTVYSLAGKSQNDIDGTFGNIAKTMRALGLQDGPVMAQVMRAVTQSMSNGYLSATQLHRELDNLPGAVAAFSQAWFNFTHKRDPLTPLTKDEIPKAERELNDAIRKKEVGGNIAIPAFQIMAQRTQPGLATAIDSPQSQVERLRTTFELLLQDMGQPLKSGGGGVMDAIAQGAKQVVELLRRDDIHAMFIRLAQGISSAINMATSFLTFLADHLNVVIPLLKTLAYIGAAESVIRLGNAFAGMGSVLTIMAGPLRGTITLLRSLVALQATAYAGGLASLARGAGGLAASGAASVAGVFSSAPQVSSATIASRLATAGVGAGAAGAATGGAAAAGGSAAAAGATTTAVAGTTAATTAATTAMTGFGAAAATAMGIATSVAGLAAAAIYKDWDATVQLSNGTTTVGTIWSELGNKIADVFVGIKNAIVSAFDWVSSKLLSALGFISGGFDSLGMKVSSWGELVTNVFTNAIAGAVNLVNTLRDLIPKDVTIDWKTGNVGFEFDKHEHVGGSDIRAQLAAQQKAREAQEAAVRTAAKQAEQDARTSGYNEHHSANNAFQAVPDAQDLRAPPGAEKGKHGKSDAEKAKDAYDELRRSLDGEEGAMARLQKAIDTVDKALKFHVITQQQATETEQAYARKMLETIGAINPVVKAQKELNDIRGMLTALAQKHLITEQQYAEAIGKTTEKLNAALYPFDSWMKKIRQETSELYDNNEARREATALRKLEQEMIDKGAPLTDDQRSAAKDAIHANAEAEKYRKDEGAGLGGLASGIGDLYTELAKAEGKIADSMSKQFDQFIKTGHFNLKSLASDIQMTLFDVAKGQIMKQGLSLLGLADKDGNSKTNGGSILGDLLGMENPRKKAQEAADAANKKAEDVMKGHNTDALKNDHQTQTMNVQAGSVSINGGGAGAGGAGPSGRAGGSGTSGTGGNGHTAGGGGGNSGTQSSDSGSGADYDYASLGSGSGGGGGDYINSAYDSGDTNASTPFDSTSVDVAGTGTGGSAPVYAPSGGGDAYPVPGAGDGWAYSNSALATGNSSDGLGGGGGNGWGWSTGGSASASDARNPGGGPNGINFQQFMPGVVHGAGSLATGNSSGALTAATGLLEKGLTMNGGPLNWLFGGGAGSGAAGASGGLFGAGGVFGSGGFFSRMFNGASSDPGTLSGMLQQQGISAQQFMDMTPAANFSQVNSLLNTPISQLSDQQLAQGVQNLSKLTGVPATFSAGANGTATATVGFNPPGVPDAASLGGASYMATNSGAFDMTSLFASQASEATADAASSAAMDATAAASAGVEAGADIGAGLFREGGYIGNPVSSGFMSAAAWANAPHYAEGTANTSGGGMPVIAHPDEAVIPLSRGRSIPVQMRGAGAGGTTHIHNWNITTPDSNSFQESKSQIESRMAVTMSRSVNRNGA